MNSISLTILLTVLVFSLASYWWINRFVKKYIPSREERKKFKKENEINRDIGHMLAPISIAMVFIINYIEGGAFKLSDMSNLQFYLNLVYLCVSSVVSILAARALRGTLLGLKKEKSRSTE